MMGFDFKEVAITQDASIFLEKVQKDVIRRRQDLDIQLRQVGNQLREFRQQLNEYLPQLTQYQILSAKWPRAKQMIQLIDSDSILRQLQSLDERLDALQKKNETNYSNVQTIFNVQISDSGTSAPGSPGSPDTPPAGATKVFATIINHADTNIGMNGVATELYHLLSELDSDVVWVDFNAKSYTKNEVSTAITSQMAKAKTEAESSSNVLYFFWYGGHGGINEKSGYETMQMSSRVSIKDTEFNKMLRDNCGTSVRVFAIFDCCHAGDMYKLAAPGFDDELEDDDEKLTLDRPLMSFGRQVEYAQSRATDLVLSTDDPNYANLNSTKYGTVYKLFKSDTLDATGAVYVQDNVYEDSLNIVVYSASSRIGVEWGYSSSSKNPFSGGIFTHVLVDKWKKGELKNMNYYDAFRTIQQEHRDHIVNSNWFKNQTNEVRKKLASPMCSYTASWIKTMSIFT